MEGTIDNSQRDPKVEEQRRRTLELMREARKDVSLLVADTCCNGQIEDCFDSEGAFSPTKGWRLKDIGTVGAFVLYAFETEGGIWRVHAQDNDSLWVVRNGTVRIETNEGTKLATPKRRVFVPENSLSRCVSKRRANGYIVQRTNLD